MRPIGLAFNWRAIFCASRCSHDRDHADAHVEDLIHLRRDRSFRAPARIWKIAGTRQLLVSMTASQFFGSTRGRLSINPPPVM